MTQRIKSNQPEPRECWCGCGENTKGGRYVQGHDARYKSALIVAALGGEKRAVARLEELGWKKFLDAKLARMGRAPVEIAASAPEPVKRKRGRPRKYGGAAAAPENAPVVSVAPVSEARRMAARIRLEPVEREITS